MDIEAIKQKIINGQMSNEELLKLLTNNTDNRPRRKNSFFKDLLKGFIEGYTAPQMWKAAMEAILIFVVITGVIILSYAGKIDMIITSVFLASVLGFLFGKIR